MKRKGRDYPRCGQKRRFIADRRENTARDRTPRRVQSKQDPRSDHVRRWGRGREKKGRLPKWLD